MLILIGYEESQTVCKAFRELGHEAYSCDIKPCSGGHPEWHLQMDVFKAIKLKPWDAAIFHPPCTFVTRASVRWLSHPDDRHLPFIHRRDHPLYPGRRKKASKTVDDVKRLWECKIPRIAIENPVGMLSNSFMKPTQIIEPWMFGDPHQKATCLWLRNLPKLTPTKIVSKGEFVTLKSGKRMPAWYCLPQSENRGAIRSVTFPGIAKAMATQWSKI